MNLTKIQCSAEWETIFYIDAKRLDWKKAEEVEHGLSAEYDLITIFNWAQHQMGRAFLSSG